MPGYEETFLIIPISRIYVRPRTHASFAVHLGAAATSVVQLALVDYGTMFCAAIAAFRLSKARC